MYTIVILMIVAPLVSSTPTHCERWKGDKEFRCGKDNYTSDKVHIRNILNDNVTFKVGKWMSRCGSPGVNYSEQGYSLGGGGSVGVEFSEVLSGTCNELFVFACKRGNSNTDCIDLVSVYPV